MIFHRSLNRTSLLAVLAAGVLALPSLVAAEEVPSFNLDYAIKHATHVVVVRADGTVLESWRGDLSAGDKLPFQSSGSPIPVVRWQESPSAVKSVTGRRRVLFLIREQPGDSWTFAGFLSTKERFGTVWIEDGQCFAQYQFLNPGQGARMHPLYPDERGLKTKLTLINNNTSAPAEVSVLRILWQRSEFLAHIKVDNAELLDELRRGEYKWRITARPKQVFKSKAETKTHETLDIQVTRIWRPGLPEPLKISIEKEREYLVFLKYQGKGFIPSGTVWALPYDTILAGQLEKLQKPDGKDNGATRPTDADPQGASVSSPTTYPVTLNTQKQHPDIGADAAALEEVDDARLRCFAFTPDSRTVAASTAAGDVILWDAASGRVQQQFTAYEGANVDWLAFAGDALVTATSKPSEVKVWDARSLALRRTFQLPGPFSKSLPPKLSPDGKSLATTWWEDQYDGRDKPQHPKRQITVWDLQTGRPRWSFDNKSVRGMSFSPDSDSIVLSYYDIRWVHLENRWSGTIQPQKMALYSVTGGEMIWEINSPPRMSPSGRPHLPTEVVFLPDGKEILGAHGPLQNKRLPVHPVAGRLMRFSAADGRLISLYISESESFGGRMALLPDHTVAFYSPPFTPCVFLWDLDGHRIRGQVAHRAMGHAAIAPDGKTMACTIWAKPYLVDLASTRPYTIEESIRYPMAAAKPASLTAASKLLENRLRGYLTGDGEELGDALRSALSAAQTISLIYHHPTPLKEGQANQAAAGLANRMHAFSTAIMMEFEGKPYSAISATFSGFPGDHENADHCLADMRLPISQGYVLDYVRILTRPRDEIIQQSLVRCRQATEAFAAGLDRLKADAGPLASWNRDHVDPGEERHPWPRYPHIEYTHQLGPPRKGPRQKLGEQWCEITLSFTPMSANPTQQPNNGFGKGYPLQGIRVSCNIRTPNQQLRKQVWELAKTSIAPLDEYERKLRDEENETAADSRTSAPIPAPVAKAIRRTSDPDPQVRLKACATLLDEGGTNKQSLQAVARLLKDPDPDVRAAVASDVGRLLEPKVDMYELFPYLNMVGITPPHLMLDREQFEEYLKQTNDRRAPRLRKEREKLKRARAEANREAGERAKILVPVLIGGLQDKNHYVREYSALALERAGAHAQPATAALIAALEDSSEAVRIRACYALRAIGPGAKQAGPALIDFISRKENVNEFEAALRAIESIGAGPMQAVPLLRRLLKDPRAPRATAAYHLGRKGPVAKSAVSDLLQALQDEDEILRRDAAIALGKIRVDSPTVLQGLERALNDPNDEVRTAADRSIRQIQKSRKDVD